MHLWTKPLMVIWIGGEHLQLAKMSSLDFLGLQTEKENNFISWNAYLKTYFHQLWKYTLF